MAKLLIVVVLTALGYLHLVEFQEVSEPFISVWDYPKLLYLGNFFIFSIIGCWRLFLPKSRFLKFVFRSQYIAGMGLWGGACLSRWIAPSCCPADLLILLLMTCLFAWPLPLVYWLGSRTQPESESTELFPHCG